jgi:hypothetical protein
MIFASPSHGPPLLPLFFASPRLGSWGADLLFGNNPTLLEEIFGQTDNAPNADVFYPAMIRSRKSI